MRKGWESFLSKCEPLVSVVIPYYNEGDLLHRAVESVRMQKYAGPVEIIVVDDASSDPAAAHLSTAPDLRIIRNASNLHAARSRNVGIENASGRYICFLDADDVYLDRRIAPHVAFLEEHPEVAMVGSSHIVTRHGKSWQYELPVIRQVCGRIPDEPMVLPPSVANEVFEAYLFHTGAFTVRSEVARAMHGFNALYHWGEEWDFYVRVARRYPIAFAPGVACEYINREGSICSTNSAQKFERMAWLYRDWRRMRPLPRAQRKSLRARHHHTLLLASQFYLEHERRAAPAWLCAWRAAFCGLSVWGLRSMVRTSIHLPLAGLRDLTDRARRLAGGPSQGPRQTMRGASKAEG